MTDMGKEEGEEEEELGVFNPAIDQILWRRTKREGSGQPEYLVKLKDYSYLHCEWVGGDEVASLGRSGRNKLNRFNKTFDQRILDKEVDPDREEEFFDPSYLKVDKILFTAEIFPVIHSKKANEIKGKWSELLSRVVSKLLNFSKDQVHYGVRFMEPVSLDKDHCPDYKKIVSHPMDLGTLANRLYLDYYKHPADAWRDTGLVFKNCRLYNRNEQSDIRVLGDTLREYAKILYRQWHKLQSERYESLLREAELKKDEYIGSHPEDREILSKSLEEELCLFTDRLFNLFDRCLETMERAEVERANREALRSYKDQFINEIGINISLFGDDSTLVTQLIKDLEKVFSFSLGLEGARAELSRIKLMIVERIESNKQPLLTRRFEGHIAVRVGLMSPEDLAPFDPGDLTFIWLKDSPEEGDPGNEEFIYFEDEEIGKVDLQGEIDRVYLVKWANMSYMDTTWELESVIDDPIHIHEFRTFNRTLDKETRTNNIEQLSRHRHLLELMINPKKKAKTPHQTVNDYKNKLYNLDIARREPLFQYNARNQPIFKHKKMLRSYQLDSLNWLIESWYNCRNVILADEMGLGKTIQSIAFLNYLHSFKNMKGPFLVVAPLSTLQHWKRTVEDWSTMNCVLYYDVNGLEGRNACRYYEWYLTDISVKGAIVQTAELCKFNILITSFEVFLQDMKGVLANLPFQHIIIDEAHRLKNQNAKILGALKQLPCERILLLTGTPIQNNTAELWTLLNFIEPVKFYSETKFLAEYGELSNAEQVEKLHLVLRPYLLRRMKEDVEKSIPPLQETIIDIEMTNIQKTIYKALYENNKGMLMKGTGFHFNASLNNLEMQLRKCCNHPFLMRELQIELTKDCNSQAEYLDTLITCSGKMILLDKLLEKIIKEDSKVLIFSQFTNMLILIEEYLKIKALPFEKIDGGVKAKERQNSIDRFNSPQCKVNVFLLSTKAGGVGINLTSANVVIIFDSDWNPQNDVQATARAHRIGQENEVKVYRLITTKTYEAEMFERASKKLGLDQAIFMGANFDNTTKLKGEDDNLKKLSKAEIETLLKKGIMGLLEAENEHTQTHQSIDEIIKNSRVAKYSLINGNYTFSKSSYAAEQTDQGLQLNDPNFWGLVFKNTESDCEKLLKRFATLETNEGFSPETLKTFMQDLIRIFNKLIEAKIKVDGYSVDDENKLNEILAKVTSHTSFNNKFKDLAFQMLTEIQKPSRRCKNIDISKLETTLSLVNPLPKPKKKGVTEIKDEEDNIYKEASEEETIFQNVYKPKDRMPKKKPQEKREN